MAHSFQHRYYKIAQRLYIRLGTLIRLLFLLFFCAQSRNMECLWSTGEVYRQKMGKKSVIQWLRIAVMELYGDLWWASPGTVGLCTYYYDIKLNFSLIRNRDFDVFSGTQGPKKNRIRKKSINP